MSLKNFVFIVNFGEICTIMTQNHMTNIFRYISRSLFLVFCGTISVFCAKSPIGSDEGKLPVEFSGISVETKADPEQKGFVAGDEIAVSAYHVPNGSEIMYNQKVSFDGNLWTYSPPAYYPAGEGTSASFFAYYPHNQQNASAGVKIDQSMTSGEPSFTFTLNSSASVDLMAAAKRRHTYEDGPVPLVFSHLLGQVQYRFAVSDEGGFSYIVNKMKLTNACSEGKYVWATDKFSVTAGKTMEVQVGSDDKEYLVNTTKPILIEDFTMYLLPGKMGSLTVGINNEEPQTIDLSEITIESGKSIILTFGIGVTGIKFSTSITSWNDGGTANGNIR